MHTFTSAHIYFKHINSIQMEYLYNETIVVHDKDRYVTRNDKSSDFNISFSSKLTATKAKGDVFTKTTKLTTVSKSWDKSTLQVAIAIPKLLSYSIFKLFIAGILEVHIDALIFNNEPISNNAYDKLMIISGETIEITIKSVNKPRNNGYIQQVLPEIEKLNSFISNIHTQYKTNEVTAHIDQFYTQISFAMYSPQLRDIDIVRLFNINSTSDKFPKIRVHSDKLNAFKGDHGSSLCTIKTNNPTLRPLSGFEGTRNECVFLCSECVFGQEDLRLTNQKVMNIIALLQTGQVQEKRRQM